MRQFARKNRITAFLFIKAETRMSKREKSKTAVDTKPEKPGILSAKTEKPVSKVTKTAKPPTTFHSKMQRADFTQLCHIRVVTRYGGSGIKRVGSWIRRIGSEVTALESGIIVDHGIGISSFF